MPMFIDRFDLVAHIKRQQDFSERTFGPGDRLLGISDHIRKELLEVAAAHDPRGRSLEVLKEWVDIILLSIDGAWRAGFCAEEIAAAIQAKQIINEERRWPDWRAAALGKAIEHERTPAEKIAKAEQQIGDADLDDGA